MKLPENKLLKTAAILTLLFSLGFIYLLTSSTSNIKSEINTEKNESKPTVASATIEITKSKGQLYKVIKVIDGDTIDVDINGKKETLRLIGLDTPETLDPRKPVQCFGIEASNKAKELLSGKNVILENDTTQGERDRYNRLLRYVFLEDGTFYNKHMISEGYAYEYTYQNNPYKYQNKFKDAEKKARENKKGLWKDNACSKSSIETSKETKPPINTNSNEFTCSGKTLCGQMTNCQEAYFYLNNCNLGKIDADKDGVPCESLCR